MRKPILLLVSLLGSVCGFSQSCPSFPTCPQATVLYCDYSMNDSSLWRAEPYTWSPTVLSPDLYEGTAEIHTLALVCPSGDTPLVSYAIFMDLNDDNLEETVVESDHLPPPGCVLFGNLFNPGYAGGDTLRFDGRGVPDSLQFRFALEYSVDGDSLNAFVRWHTTADPDNYILPRMPEGRHRIVWTIRQDSVERQCQRNFRIKDCLPPDLECAPGVTVQLNAAGEYTLTAQELAVAVNDLVTPYDLLEFSFREQGTGAGFPLDSAGNPRSTRLLQCRDLGEHTLELWVRDRSGNADTCAVTIQVLADPVVCPPRKPVFCARAFWSPYAEVASTQYELLYYNQDSLLTKRSLPAASGSCAQLDTLPGLQAFSIVPSSDFNPLNGVSTFDLVQISRHILQVTPLDAPWKLLAADANGNGQVTATDILELRKLILGINQQLNNNESWRYYPADCDFPANPFTIFCAPWYSFMPMPYEAFDSAYYFNALKIGDVNGSADPSSLQHGLAGDRDLLDIFIPRLQIPLDAVTRVPLYLPYSSFGYSGLQMGLHTGTGLDILAIESEDLPGFGTSHYFIDHQKITISWVAPSDMLQQPVRSPVMWLTVRAQKDMHLQEALALDETRLRAELYSGVDDIHPLQLQFVTKQPATDEIIRILPVPNPSSGPVDISLLLSAQGIVNCQIFDLAGQLLFESEKDCPAGASRITVPTTVFPESGVYLWRVQTGGIQRSGRLIWMKP